MTAKPINESTLLFVIKLLKADVLDGKTVTRAGISTMPAKAENSVRLPPLYSFTYKVFMLYISYYTIKFSNFTSFNYLT